MSRGKYIVIEGPEGVGKTAQVLALSKKLESAGLPTKIFSDPISQVDLTATTIKSMTENPNYPMNTRTEVLLYNAARSQSLEIIKKSVANGIYCLCDRNYLTTLTILFYGRGSIPDYNLINQIINFAVAGVEPDLTIVMDAPPNILKERNQKKESNQESFDEQFIERIRAGYLWEANQRQYPVIFSTQSLNETSDEIWKLVTPVIANRETSQALLGEPSSIKEIISEKLTSLQAMANGEPAITQNEGPIEAAPKVVKDDYSINDIVTNTNDNVYAFTDNISPFKVVSTIAGLNKDTEADIRKMLKDELISASTNLNKPLQNPTKGSFTQLANQYVFVEGASHLLVSRLENFKNIRYIEQPIESINYAQKDENEHYKYFLPTSLNSAVKKIYIRMLNSIFKRYSEMSDDLLSHIKQTSVVPEGKRNQNWHKLAEKEVREALAGVLPIAAKNRLGLFGSCEAINDLIIGLQSDELEESRVTGSKILDSVKTVAPTFYDNLNKKATKSRIAYEVNKLKNLKDVTNKLLPYNYGYSNEPIILSNHYPRNELELVSEMLYENSNLPISEINKQVDKWQYSKKTEVFGVYIGERSSHKDAAGSAFEKAAYTWDLVCDFDLFRKLQNNARLSSLTGQSLSPRYGYDVPDLIEQASLTEKFQECFDVSLELYSLMQESGYSLEAQYATLMGHKMHCQLSYTAEQAFYLHKSFNSSQNYQKLISKLQERLSEVHPLIGEAISSIK
jgi:dTMP kinase